MRARGFCSIYTWYDRARWIQRCGTYAFDDFSNFKLPSPVERPRARAGGPGPARRAQGPALRGHLLGPTTPTRARNTASLMPWNMREPELRAWQRNGDVERLDFRGRHRDAHGAARGPARRARDDRQRRKNIELKYFSALFSPTPPSPMIGPRAACARGCRSPSSTP